MENIKEQIRDIIEQYLKRELSQLFQCVKEKRMDDAHVYYGKVMGKIDLIPYCINNLSSSEVIGKALYEIYSFTNGILTLENFCSDWEYYICIMEVIEDESKS